MVPIIFFIFILVSCHGIDNINSRARNFSIELVNSTDSDNVVIAPFTVWCLMVGVALWTYGESQEQISNTLILPENKTIFLNEYSNLKRIIYDEKSDGVDISSGIFIFTRNDFDVLPAFKETMTKHFGAVFKALDFENTKEAVYEANYLIENNVRFILNVFRPEDFINTTMIMSSAISFNGYWKSHFNVSHTTEKSYPFNNDIYYVKMMHNRLKLPFSSMESLNANVMELAIGQDGKFCVLLILPYPSMDIREVYKKLYKVTLKNIFDKLQNDVNEFGLREVNLTLPKIKIETGIVLNKPLSEIGLNDVFESEKSEFLGITRDDIYISSIDHTCSVHIVETGVYIRSTTPGFYDYNIRNPKLEAEQPFIFFVMEKSTQTIMFGGLYSKARYVI